MSSKIVVHYVDGSIVKGHSGDLDPETERFHLIEKDSGEEIEVALSELKAVFFVKTFEGQSGRTRRNDVERIGLEKHILVKFKDGEKIVGYPIDYSHDRPIFFVFPVDVEGNNAKILVVKRNTDSVIYI